MSKELQQKVALEKAEANVNYLASLPDASLIEKLEAVHLQMELAEQKKNTAALELLEVWRSQIIAARIYKHEENVPDLPDEISEAIATIETVTARAEERKEILALEEEDFPEPKPKKKTPATSTESQLPLF